MSEQKRCALFISHANPEDNEFTLWLGSRLSAAGYEAWADVLRLRGGHDWQRRLEEALRTKAFKVLLVGTATGVQKQGVRNEIQIATDTGRKICDKDFIIPLRLEPFEAPFLIVHAQYIDFQRGWGAGLAELLETLEGEYQVPRTAGPNAESIDRWKRSYQHRARTIAKTSEPLISNWIAIKTWPSMLRYYDFKNPVDHSRVRGVLSLVRCPLYRYGRGFFGFGSVHDYAVDLPDAFAVAAHTQTPTERFVAGGEPALGIGMKDARNLASHLITRGWDRLMEGRGLRPYEYAGGTKAWWVPDDVLPSVMISFRWPDGPAGRRALIGGHKGVRWHLGVTAKPWLSDQPHVRLIPRVIFTADQAAPLEDTRRTHRLRRSVARDWRNSRWRDMVLAFLFWLSNGGTVLSVPIGSASSIEFEVPPVQMLSPVSIVDSGDTGAQEADLAKGDVVFERDDDESEDEDPDGDDDA